MSVIYWYTSSPLAFPLVLALHFYGLCGSNYHLYYSSDAILYVVYHSTSVTNNTMYITTYTSLTPNHAAEDLHLPSYRVCWHELCTVLTSYFSVVVLSLMAWVYDTLTVILNSLLPGSGSYFAHWPNFPTAAFTWSQDSVSVPIWLYSTSQPSYALSAWGAFSHANYHNTTPVVLRIIAITIFLFWYCFILNVIPNS